MMETSISNFIEAIKSIKKTYAQQFFEKSGLHAALSDLFPGIDRKFLNVLKKADDYSLYTKISQLAFEQESIKSIEIAKYRQDFTENIGLDSTIAEVVFDAYLFGLGMSKNIDSEDYLKEAVVANLNLKDLIEMATADGRLERSEMHNIFKKAAKFGVSEKDVFKELTNVIKQSNLKPLNAVGEVKITNKLTLMSYDWVDESIFRDEKINLKTSQDNAAKEQELIAALQRKKELADQKVKELELEYQRRNERAKLNAERLRQAEEALKAAKEKVIINNEKSKGRISSSWLLIIAFLGCFIVWSLMGFGSSDSSESDAQVLSTQLEKKYEKINYFILNDMIDSANILLPELVHPSKEKSPFKSDRLLDENYSYNEYWQIKKQELSEKIETHSLNKLKNQKKKDRGKRKNKNAKESLTYNQVSNSKIYKVSDRDGYSSIRSSPSTNSKVVLLAVDGEKVKIIGKNGDWRKIINKANVIGFIHKSRLVKIANNKPQKSISPWEEMGISKEDYEQLLNDGYIN